jgi:hypothetical protein
MRAKLLLATVVASDFSATLEFHAVTEKPFDANGKSEDNDFARWTPSADLKMVVNNPDLIGKFKQGQTFYVDFTDVATAGAVKEALDNAQVEKLNAVYLAVENERSALAESFSDAVVKKLTPLIAGQPAAVIEALKLAMENEANEQASTTDVHPDLFKTDDVTDRAKPAVEESPAKNKHGHVSPMAPV